jgi:hypothetical protein
MLFGLSRVAATEFSFFLAIPTLFAATGYSLWKDAALLTGQSLPAFCVGFVAAFVSAFACVRWLIRYVSHHDFVPFAWYRIAFGAVILATTYAGLVQWASTARGLPAIQNVVIGGSSGTAAAASAASCLGSLYPSGTSSSSRIGPSETVDADAMVPSPGISVVWAANNTTIPTMNISDTAFAPAVKVVSFS